MYILFYQWSHVLNIFKHSYGMHKVPIHFDANDTSMPFWHLWHLCHTAIDIHIEQACKVHNVYYFEVVFIEGISFGASLWNTHDYMFVEKIRNCKYFYKHMRKTTRVSLRVTPIFNTVYF
jgi:hypothetical protein